MQSTYMMLAGVWAMFAMMAVVALSARRRSRKIDRMMRDAHIKTSETRDG